VVEGSDQGLAPLKTLGNILQRELDIRRVNNPIFDEQCCVGGFKPGTRECEEKRPNCLCERAEEGSGIEMPNSYYVDPVDDDAVRDHFAFVRSQQRNCYQSQKWKIEIPANKTVPGRNTVNYLDYISTHELVLDIGVYRDAIGVDKLTCYGQSYGTGVCSTYAAVWHDHIGRLVLNGNVGSGIGMTTSAFMEMNTEAYQQQGTKLLEMCTDSGPTGANCLGSLGRHPMEEFEMQLNAVREAPLYNGTYSLPTKNPVVWMKFNPAMIYDLLDNVRGEKTKAGWNEVLRKLIDYLKELEVIRTADDATRKEKLRVLFNDFCGPSWEDEGKCKQNELKTIGAPSAINALDYSGRFGHIQTTKKLKGLLDQFLPFAVWKGMDTGGNLMMYPAEATPSMFGFRQDIKAVIINSLYDGATPFTNAKTMRAGFTSGVLMTWQGVGHIVDTADYDPEGVAACMHQVQMFVLSKGDYMPKDGYVCRNSQPLKLEQEEMRRVHTASMLAKTKVPPYSAAMED